MSLIRQLIISNKGDYIKYFNDIKSNKLYLESKKYIKISNLNINNKICYYLFQNNGYKKLIIYVKILNFIKDSIKRILYAFNIKI
jgi:hypothetical protein